MDEGFGGDCHNRPSEALSFGSGWLQAALGFAFACMELFITDPPRLFVLGFAGSKLRSTSPSLAWSCSQYAISDGGFGRLGAISQPLYAGGMSLSVDRVGRECAPAEPCRCRKCGSRRDSG
ncbi:MAG: hypothetical protein PUE05_07950 [bacterium]|nr:hypothetical protein [bacterium]